MMVTDGTLRRYPSCVLVRIVGTSMQPTLMHRDIVVVDPYATDPQEGDVVAAYYKVPLAREGGMICGEWREPTDDHEWWLYKHNPTHDSYPRVSLGRIPALRAITGTVVAIIGRYDPTSELPVKTYGTRQPVGRFAVPRKRWSLSGDQLRAAQRDAAAKFYGTVAKVQQVYERGCSSLQLVPSASAQRTA